MLNQKLTGASSATNYIEDVFSTYLYTGNGTGQTITNNIDLSTQGGLVWIKGRSPASSNNVLYDTVRGAGKLLYSNLTNAQGTNLSGYDLTAFTTSGFTLGTSQNTGVNSNGDTSVSWTFRKQPKFFDVVTYTGNGTWGRQISHSLGSTPGCIIVKQTSASGQDWPVWHRGFNSGNGYGYLDLTNGFNTSGASFWGDGSTYTAPTSTNFTVSGDSGVNANGATYVAYIFAHDAGGFGLTGTDNVISCGSYTGTGAAGNTITLGYEPQWLLIKNATTSATDWMMQDVMRGLPVDGNYGNLRANLSAAEVLDSPRLNISATGFQITTTNDTYNASGQTYIYIAIRRGPMKVPTDGTTVYNGIARTGTGSTTSVTGVGFPPDMVLIQRRNGAADSGMYDKLRGPNQLLYPQYTLAESAVTSYLNSFDQDGETLGTNTPNISGQTFINWNFRRAPGFFDVTCTTGTSSVNKRTSHNLGVTPELIIVKDRTQGGANGAVYHSANGTSYWMRLDTTDAKISGSYWGSSAPTSTDWGFNENALLVGGTDAYVAYLFATCPGVSKVGSYTGNGSSQTINCGFTAGARFILIKRTDSTGDWYVWDTTRGIVSGNDPHLSLNTTSAEVTTDDTIDPDSTGFVVNQLSATNVNVSSATYIYLAIA